MRHGLRALGRAAVLLFVSWPCCVSVLDLDDYNDAIEALCKCDEDVPQFDGACVETLKGRLDGVSEGARGEWLAFYANTCDGACTAAFACFQHVGTCAQRSCSSDRECCGWEESSGKRCIEGSCDDCRTVGAECDDVGDCCALDATCDNGVCEVGASSSSVTTGGGPDDPPPSD